MPDSTVTALKEEKAVEEKAVEGIQPIMAETTPQKLNASLEKESAEATLQETSPEAPFEILSASKRKQVNYEKFIGENLFGKIGILVFVIGVGFFVKYAIDKDWINETLRTVLGFLTGSALLVVAERLQKEVPHIQFLACGWRLCRFLSHSRHCLSFLSPFSSDGCFYYSDSYNAVHVYPVHSV